jgi:TetR/AcrR family transcriptional regulator, tetracycline repressor protein
MAVNGSPRRRGRPARISRAEVLDAAMQIVDEDGLERLTMRRLGERLGVDPMAVYGHVPDKSALVDALVERVLSSVEVPPKTGDWAADLRAVVRAARVTLLRHRGLIALLGTRPPITEPAFALPELIVSVLLDAGFPEELAADGFDCAGRLLVGHTLAESARPPGEDVDGGEREHVEAQQALPAERFPGLARVQRAGVGHDPDRLFELALDGLVRALAARHPSRPAP